jgi:hypothetical protein
VTVPSGSAPAQDSSVPRSAALQTKALRIFVRSCIPRPKCPRTWSRSRRQRTSSGARNRVVTDQAPDQDPNLFGDLRPANFSFAPKDELHRPRIPSGWPMICTKTNQISGMSFERLPGARNFTKNPLVCSSKSLHFPYIRHFVRTFILGRQKTFQTSCLGAFKIRRSRESRSPHWLFRTTP